MLRSLAITFDFKASFDNHINHYVIYLSLVQARHRFWMFFALSQRLLTNSKRISQNPMLAKYANWNTRTPLSSCNILVLDYAASYALGLLCHK